MAVAQISAAHGVKGGLKVRTLTEHPETVLEHKVLLTYEGAQILLDKPRLSKNRNHTILASVEGTETRTQAERLVGTWLYISKDSLPQPEENEAYYHTLKGMNVFSHTGEPCGVIENIFDNGAHAVLEIVSVSGEATHMIPFTNDAVHRVEHAAGTVHLREFAQQFFAF